MAFSLLYNIKLARPSIAFAFQGLGLQARNGSSLGANRPTSQPLLSVSKNGVSLPHSSAFDQRRHYAMRLELTEHGIVWRRPKYIPSWTPPKSGDLEPHVDPDGSRPLLKLRAAKDAFEEADDITKKYLSIKFAPHEESMKVVRHDTLKKVQRHKYDVGSMECEIAMLTVKIRNLQEATNRNRKDILSRCRLNELIDRRKKVLKRVRRMDYKRFEWLLEELKIHYRPPPTAYHWITRKDSLRKLVQMHKQDIRTQRLEEYKQALKDQEEAFLKEKAETLQWIAKVEAELGVPATDDVDSVASKS